MWIQKHVLELDLSSLGKVVYSHIYPGECAQGYNTCINYITQRCLTRIIKRSIRY